jgi:predicted alpha/beta-hydrolase family hydrolase
MQTSEVTIPVDAASRISGLLVAPRDARALFVMALGTGAGMKHPFMSGVAKGLAERGIGTLRYQFPYMEQGARRPDPPQLAHAAVRAAVAAAQGFLPALPVMAGGKSFGGRMTSQAQAASKMPGVRGIVFLGFPLHPAGQPSNERARHLSGIGIPMLFLQGARDALADLKLLRPIVRRIGESATLRVFDGADHSFHIPARSGRSDAEVMADMLDALAAWTDKVIVPAKEPLDRSQPIQ